MSFSMDSKYLAAQCGKPEWILHFYAWEKGKSIATIAASPSGAPVHQISINSFDGTEICVTGKGFVTIYRYTEGILKPIHVIIPQLVPLTNTDVQMPLLVIN
jgi:cilia- and flagella-associated protein 57